MQTAVHSTGEWKLTGNFSNETVSVNKDDEFYQSHPPFFEYPGLIVGQKALGSCLESFNQFPPQSQPDNFHIILLVDGCE